MSFVKYFDCSLADLHVDMQELYLLMGYGNHTPDAGILDLINEMLLELHGICKPHYGYVHTTGEIVDKEHIQVGDVVFNPGKIITSVMREATSFVVFTATIGPAFDEWCHQLRKEGDMVKPFVADALGSVLAEATASRLMMQLADDMEAQGLYISNSYSPGYCDWFLLEQKKLFSLIPDNVTGITLTDSCLMLPIKSVSGIVGIGEQMKKRAYSCEICRMITCVKNKKKQSAEMAVNN